MNNIKYRIVNNKKFIFIVPLNYKKKLENCELNGLELKINQNFIEIYLKSDFNIYILDEPERYLYNDKKDYILEYGSVNPTGFIHAGNFRNLIIGKFFGDILELITCKKIYRQYYINDEGNQISEVLNDRYNNSKFFNNISISAIEYINEININMLKFKNFHFDELIYQSYVTKNISDEKILYNFQEYLNKSEDGKYYLKHPKNERFIYLKNNSKNDSYFMGDLKLHEFKSQKYPNYTQIIVLGEDQTEMIKNLNIYLPQIRIIKYGTVTYNNKKFSKRANYTMGNEMIELNMIAFKIAILSQKLSAPINLTAENIHNYNQLSKTIKYFMEKPFICIDENEYALIVIKIFEAIELIYKSFNNTTILINALLKFCEIGISSFNNNLNLFIMRLISTLFN